MKNYPFRYYGVGIQLPIVLLEQFMGFKIKTPDIKILNTYISF